MTFLNATLLLGFLAASIPIALHLLGRREPKRVAFPAVRFLTQRLETNRRRLQVRQWILLGMRVALLALLAASLAQPQIHRAVTGTWIGIGSLLALGLVVVLLALMALAKGRPQSVRWSLLVVGLLLMLGALGWGASVVAGGPRPVQSTTAPAAVAVMIDNSPTSAYLTDGEATRLDAAREMGTWILSQYPAESRFALIDRSARPATFALDAAAVQRGLSATRTLESVRPISERIEAAIRLLKTSQLPRKTLFVLTDLSAAGWDSEATDSTTLAPLIAEDPEVAVQVVDVGSEAYRNRFLGAPEIVDATPPRDVTSTISVVVGTASEPPAERAASPLTVQLRLYEAAPGLPAERNGEIELPGLRTVDRQIVPLSAGAGRADLILPPLEVGTHHGRIELVEGDSLAVDNTRYFTVQVSPPRPILVVADDVREQQIIGNILNPHGIDDPRREYAIDFAKTGGLRDLALEPYAAIGLFNPTLPPPIIRDKIEAWVSGGGQLLVALGPALDANGSGSAVKWPLVGNPQRIWRSPEPGTFLQVLQSSHPALAALAAVPGGAPWNAFRIHHYWQLGDAAEWSEMMRYAGTEHLAVGQHRWGRGRAIVMTTPLPAVQRPANQWNDLLALSRTNAWPVMIPFLQQMFEDLSGGLDSELNVPIGQPVVVGISAEASRQFQLFAPNSPPVPLDAAEGAIVAGAPLAAGNYWLRGAQGDRYGFSANLPTAATSLERVAPTLLDDLLGVDAYHLVREQQEIEIAEGESSDSRPLYSLLMLLAAALFMLEQYLSNRFYGGRPAHNASRNQATGTRSPVAAA